MAQFDGRYYELLKDELDVLAQKMIEAIAAKRNEYAKQEDRCRKKVVGASVLSAAAIGAIAGGPVGAIFGALFGGVVSSSSNLDNFC